MSSLVAKTYKPWPYQVHAGQHIRNTPACGLFLDMGLGKTVVTLTELEWQIYQNGCLDKILVIGPKQVVRSVWKQEAEKWAHLQHLKVSIVWGTEKQRLEALRVEADIYLINRENVVWLVGLYQTAWPFKTVVVDELSSFKSHSSQRFKALKMVRKYIDRFIGLTGTPAPNSLLDIWAPIFLMDQGERLEKTITGYRDRYFVAKTVEGYVAKYVIRKEAEEVIYRKIGDICISMKAKDYLDLPPVIVNDIIIELPDNIQGQYDRFEEEQIMQLKDAEITALNAGALTNKLLQFANGAIYHSDPTQKVKSYSILHDEKLNRLEELMDEAQGNPVMVFYAFRHDAELIKKKFPYIRSLKTPQDIEDWNNGKIRMMMAHPASAGHGLNLQSGGHLMVWYGQTWSLELYMQAIARLARQGQTKSVVVNRLVVAHTMDIRVIRALAEKERGQEALMEAVKALVDNYKSRRRVA